MEIKNVQRRERKSVPISLRVTKPISEWMRKHNISPTKVFNTAIDELIKEQVNKDVSENGK